MSGVRGVSAREKLRWRELRGRWADPGRDSLADPVPQVRVGVYSLPANHEVLLRGRMAQSHPLCDLARGATVARVPSLEHRSAHAPRIRR